MRKVCLVSYTAPYTIPYIDIYLKIFKQNGIQCDVVYWDREGKIEHQNEEHIKYYPNRGISSMNESRLKRYIHYIPAREYG